MLLCLLNYRTSVVLQGVLCYFGQTAQQPTYSLHTSVGLPVDERPEHVRPKDVVPTLDNEQRVPELCIAAVHLL